MEGSTGLKTTYKSNLGKKFNYDSWLHDMEFLSIACRRSIEAPLLFSLQADGPPGTGIFLIEPELRLAADEDDWSVWGDGPDGGRPLLQRREERRRVGDLVAEEDGVGRAAGVLPGLVVAGRLRTCRL